MIQQRNNQSIRRGFTLVEMMIVIGIIALLAALTLGISSSVMRNAEIRKTEDALKLMTMALQEWELEKGRSITFEGYAPYIHPETGALGMYDIYADEYIVAPTLGEQGVIDVIMLHAMETRIESLIVKLMNSESASAILGQVSPDFFIEHIHTSDGTKHKVVVDSWGTPIGVVFPGRNYYDVNPNGGELAPSYDRSGDQTVRDESEDGLGSCINARPYFVSAGPDRLWGYRFQSNDINSGPGIEIPANSGIFLWEYSLDNIYSYEPFLVESAR